MAGTVAAAETVVSKHWAVFVHASGNHTTTLSMAAANRYPVGDAVLESSCLLVNGQLMVED